MSMSKHLSSALLGILLASLFLYHSYADVGTASHYGPPYLPTACYGNDASQFPSSFLFAAANEPIWDNGINCGKLYSVKCISASKPGICRDEIIQVIILDHAQSSVSQPSSSGATLFLSRTAFELIAKGSASLVNIEYLPV